MIIFVAIVNLLFVFVVSFLIRKKQPEVMRGIFWPALLLKVTAGILLGVLYKEYYTGGDTFRFFQDAKQLSDLFRHDAGTYFRFLWSSDASSSVWQHLTETQPRSLFFTKAVSVINLVTADNYWITAVYFSTLSFFASWYLVRKITILIPESKWSAAIAFLFFPTVVFWSSGIIKESLAMTSLFFLAGLFVAMKAKTKISWIEWVLMPICLWLLWMLKYYWAVVFIPAVLATMIMQSIIVLQKKKFRIQILSWSILFLLICSTAILIHPNFYPEYFLGVIIENNQQFNLISEPQNLIHYHNLDVSVWSMLINSPWALLSGLIRPFLFEGGNAVKLMYAFENLVIVLFVLSSLINIKRIQYSPFRVMVVATIIFSIVLCIFLALSTPNFGTLSRYRIGFLPFLVFVLMYKNPWFEKFASRASIH